MSEDLTPREVAQELGVTVRTVQRWIADGRLAASRVGSRVRVSRSSLSSVADGPPAPHRGITTLLVANRGEIAARIARSAKGMGIRVIGVHAADERAPDGADESHEIGSYLDGNELLAVAVRSVADAVHPGYGFLAENPAFARAVTDAGLTWVGPPHRAIAAMGDKAAARRQAAAHGVPIVPGYDGPEQDDRTLSSEAERIGYPLLVKPTAGGGGKGMRVVRGAGELVEALGAARREADRSFGDDRLILERYLEGPRHVELQVLFDAQGNGLHLGERDCSAQRRNQKIVEEAPAPSVTPELRARMGEAAVTVAASVGYVNAGTVEMLLTDTGEFFFLEMNTRLQVEHPVTEMVTGRDLVADQLRIAGGESLAALGLRSAPPIRGHAIEARLYAEDPDAGFLPATGRVARLVWPDGVRIDAGIHQGDEVGDRYDPMLAKVIAHGRTRPEALDRLRAALADTTVLGVRSNLRFLRWLLDQERMREGELRTDTISKLDPPPPTTIEPAHWQAAASLLIPASTDPWAGGWRVAGPASLRLRHEDEERSVLLTTPESAVEAVHDGAAVHVDVGGQSLEFVLAPAPTVEDAVRHASSAGGDGASVLTAPMPGRVIAVRAVEGARIAAHQAVVIIEAMKMEHAVVAPLDGRLARVHVTEGQQVRRGEVLAEVAAYHDADG
ncbi:MAG TPA: biotin carboxylase N-terminal domain-containing protein [Candidatus Limnocylindrales bacterium]|nr:biotin carboxylase N-terminal domain-containing protein [Candidatus Limnocylindrales bacterium]